MKRSQVSLEYLIVLAVSFLMLIPGLYLVMNYARSSSGEILGYQISQIGVSIVDTAQTVDGYGKDAMIVLELEFPKGIRNMTIANNTYLMIDAQGIAGGQFFRSLVNITGTFTNDDFSAGRKKFRVESKGDYISITRV